jgi:L,D-transpeptidase ErfK/SrfK
MTMRQAEQRLARLVAAAIVVTAEAMAQDRAARRIVVSIPDRTLTLMEEDRVLKVYRTAVGAPATPSPAGVFQVIQRLPDPTWYGPGKVVPPGKSNPLGTRWLGLSRKGYGIHGTNAPKSIGKRASHGCIRMRNHDIEELFELVSVGDTVELIGEPLAQVASTSGGGQ